MIASDDVRRTDRTTLTFFPDGLADEVRHFMALVGITKQQYEILSCPDTQARYPNLDVPAVPFDPRLKDVRSTYCRAPSLIISNMNPDDLQRKIYEIHLSSDRRRTLSRPSPRRRATQRKDNIPWRTRSQTYSTTTEASRNLNYTMVPSMGLMAQSNQNPAKKPTLAKAFTWEPR